MPKIKRTQKSKRHQAAPFVNRFPTKIVPIDAVAPYELNYNAHPDSQVGMIADGVKRLSQYKNIVIWKNKIIAGEGVWRGMKQAGATHIEVKDASTLSKTEANALMMWDNEGARTSEPDQSALAALVKLVNDEDEALAKLAAGDAKALRELMAQANAKEETADPGELVDRAEELQKKWQVKRGDLWQCGKHRILCGDSTNADDVARVMGGKRAQYCFTSPPYGIGLDYEKDDSLKELVALILGIIHSIDSIIDYGYATMNYSDVFRKGDAGFTLMSGYYDEPFRKLGWWLRGNRVWFKPFGRLALSYATGTTMNLREWEYVQTWRKGNGQENHHEHGLTIRGVWKTFGDDAIIPDWKQYDDTTEKTTHQSAFPVVLPIVGIRSYTDAGDIVFEPFIGSGTTIVACEKTGRIGRGIEIEPKYVAVTLERLSLLGLTCERISSA